MTGRPKNNIIFDFDNEMNVQKKNPAVCDTETSSLIAD